MSVTPPPPPTKKQKKLTKVLIKFWIFKLLHVASRKEFPPSLYIKQAVLSSSNSLMNAWVKDLFGKIKKLGLKFVSVTNIVIKLMAQSAFIVCL